MESLGKVGFSSFSLSDLHRGIWRSVARFYLEFRGYAVKGYVFFLWVSGSRVGASSSISFLRGIRSIYSLSWTRLDLNPTCFLFYTLALMFARTAAHV